MYGVLNMLRSLIMQYKPTHAAVVFDAKEKPFVMNCLNITNHIARQCRTICVHKSNPCAMVKAMGLPLLAVSGVEADDVIGTLAREAEKPGVRC